MSQPPSYVPLEGQKDGFSSHDTSRAYFHHKDLAAFSEDVNNAAKRAFPNRGRSRYDTVNVCLIRWKDDELGVQHELNALDYIFQCYGFRTNVFLIPTLNSHWTLMREALDFIQLHDNDRNLFMLYYAGHGRMNSARQAEWVFGQSPSSPFVDWSAIQGLFGTAKSDVLILLDTCAAASSATKSQFAVMETIAACGFERRAPAPGEHSMTNTLIEVLRDWINKPSFSAASLHTEILVRLKLKETKRGRAGVPLEWCVTPIHWINTKDCKASGIELCRRNPLPSSPSATPSGETHDETESSTYVDPMEIDFDDKSSGSTPLSSVSSDGSYKVPHVLITLQLEQNQPLDARQCARWLDKFPLLAKWVKVEAVFPSYSTLMILSIPMPIWDLLPDHPACSFIGYSTSPRIEFPPISNEVPAITVPDLTQSSSQALAGVKTENDSSVEELAIPKIGKRKLIDEDAHEPRDLLSDIETRRLVSANLDISRQKNPGQTAKGKRPFDSFDFAPKENLEQGTDSLGLPMMSFDPAGDRSVESRTESFERKKGHSHPKLKMGCSNCRARQVKCDETRPACIKCVRSGKACTGYQPYGKTPQVIPIKPPPTNSAVISGQPVHIIHKDRPLVSTDSKNLVSSIIHQPEEFRLNGQESRYISVFQKHSMSDLAGIFDSGSWIRSVLQSTQSEATIRHAVVALGALYQTLEGAPETSPRSTEITSLNLAINHYHFALQQYGRAIVQLRTDLENKEASSTVVLMSIILFACFQSFTGDLKSAAIQISHGLGLLEEQRQTSPRPFLDGKGNIDEERHIQVFTRLALQAKSCDDAFNFPQPYRIRLYPRERSHSFPRITSPPSQDFFLSAADFETPLYFTTLQEARLAFDNLWERIMHVNEFLSSYPGGRSESLSEIVQASTHDFEARLEEWDFAFKSLLKARQRSGISTIERRGINVLKMTYLTVYILLLKDFSTSETDFDIFLPHFEDIIRLAEDVVFNEGLPPTQAQQAGEPNSAPYPSRNDQEGIKEIKTSFAIDLGIVFPLFTVATRCRDRSLRRAALRLLLSRPRREGMWDSILSGRVAKWIIQIEEEGLSPWVGADDDAAKEEVMLENRVIAKEVLFDLQRKEATIRYGARVVMEDNEDPDPREGTHHIRW